MPTALSVAAPWQWQTPTCPSRAIVRTTQDTSVEALAIKAFVFRFLLATLQLDVIAQSTTKQEVEKELKHMLSDLNKSYTKTLERVNQQTKNFRTLAYRVLLWLSQVRRP